MYRIPRSKSQKAKFSPPIGIFMDLLRKSWISGDPQRKLPARKLKQKKTTHFDKTPSFLAKRDKQSSDSPILLISPQIA
jgi:hypothetical protein